jgi:hypothetical protein
MILPNNTSVIRGLSAPPEVSVSLNIAAPAAVTVHWAVGERCPPYSSGNLNWRSAAQKCEAVAAAILENCPLSMNI